MGTLSMLLPYLCHICYLSYIYYYCLLYNPIQTIYFEFNYIEFDILLMKNLAELNWSSQCKFSKMATVLQLTSSQFWLPRNSSELVRTKGGVVWEGGPS